MPQLQPVKNKHDPRHLRRIKNMRALYAHSFQTKLPKSRDSQKIISHLAKIDKIIQKNAPKWPLVKINKVDLSILRITIWELIYRQKTPPKVAIDEAIELGKEYGTQSSASFINGVLGGVIKKLKITKKNQTRHESRSKPTPKTTKN